MPDTRLEIGARHHLAKAAKEALTTDHLTNDDFVGDRDYTVTELLIQKPADTDLKVWLVASANGVDITVLLLHIDPLDPDCADITTGIYLGEEKISVPEGDKIRITTAGGASGAKRVMLLGERIDA